MMKALYIFIFMIGSIATAQDRKAPSSASAIHIYLEETAFIDSFEIKFLEVIEDSRCPTGLDCFWQGQAKVKVAILNQGTITGYVELLFGEKPNLMIFDSQDFTIEAQTLLPYPTAETQGSLDYILVIEKIQKK